MLAWLRWLSLCFGVCGLCPLSAAAAEKPNVVFVLIDDMGWTDLGCFGSQFYETPNIDRLCARGMKFTNAYAACCVCSPTRASILTGKHPARLHLTDWIAGHKRPFAKLAIPDWTQRLPLAEVTLAEALRPAGYATAAVGKWHLGDEQYRPEVQGFERNFAGDHRGQPPSYFWPYKIPGVESGAAGEYLTDRLGDEAIKFIESRARQPFFLYLAHYAVHTPLQAKKELVAKYQAKVRPDGAQNNAVYAAMIESVDDCVGRLVKKLDELQLAQRTIIFFMSDNGGLMRSTSNAPLRDGKGTPWEGGVRVPLFCVWPGVTKPGSVCSTPVISTDFYPTILEMTGVAGDRRHNAQVDGRSFASLLKQEQTPARDGVYWHYPHYHPCGATPYGAVRSGDYKLVEFYEDNHVELYNLKDDLSESVNLAQKQPELAEKLRQQLHRWRVSVGAQMPSANPDADPARDGKTQKPKRKARPEP